MSIKSSDLYREKQNQFDAQGSSSRFANDYIRAVNNGLDEYAIVLDLSSHPSHIAKTDATIDIDANRQFAFSAIVDYWLVLWGHRSGDLDIKTAFAAKQNALRDVLLDRDLTASRAADANSDADVIGMFYSE